MKTIIVCHSFSGVTRGVRRTGPVRLRRRPRRGPATPVLHEDDGGHARCIRARSGGSGTVEPAQIDVSGYDRIVIGTPVQAWRPTPVILGAIEALAGADGKSAVVFATCGAQAGETLPMLRAALAAKGVDVVGEFSFTTPEAGDDQKVGALIARVSE